MVCGHAHALYFVVLAQLSGLIVSSSCCCSEIWAELNEVCARTQKEAAAAKVSATAATQRPDCAELTRVVCVIVAETPRADES